MFYVPYSINIYNNDDAYAEVFFESLDQERPNNPKPEPIPAPPKPTPEPPPIYSRFIVVPTDIIL